MESSLEILLLLADIDKLNPVCNHKATASMLEYDFAI
jgi:hypothetical protein